MGIAEELAKLEALRTSGALTEAEYARAKALVLNGQPAAVPGGHVRGGPNLLQSFTRSRQDKILGGVCGGLGRSTPVPSWAWRLAFCLLFLGFGSGLILYVLLWIFVPAEPW
jgi:phage shock protein PspC (stress-responsive transcriptional regulator)